MLSRISSSNVITLLVNPTKIITAMNKSNVMTTMQLVLIVWNKSYLLYALSSDDTSAVIMFMVFILSFDCFYTIIKNKKSQEKF